MCASYYTMISTSDATRQIHLHVYIYGYARKVAELLRLKVALALHHAVALSFFPHTLSVLQGFLFVPKPFATSLSKSGLVEEHLMKQLRRATGTEEVSHVVAHWIRQMLNEHERMSSISQNGQTLTANGFHFRVSDLVSLTRKR